MGTRLPKNRGRWIALRHPPTRPNKRGMPQNAYANVSSVYDEDGSISSTAMILHEDEHDDSPVDTGILDEHGDQIYRLPWRDTLPMGFHYTADQYDEDGNFIYEDEYEE